MRCFITGATGFIGSAIAQQLIEKNYEVAGLTHSPEKIEKMEKKEIRPIVGDMRRPEQWISSVQGADVVIHTATIPVPGRPSRRYMKKLTHAQRTVVTHLIEAAASCSVFIYTSGMTVYGHGKEKRNERSALNPVELARPYVVGEQLVLDAVKQKGLPGMILRPGGVYGDGGSFAKYWTTPISNGKRASYPGNGRQIKSFISLDDCVQAYIRCIENPMLGEIFNVVDNEPVAFGTLIRFLAAEMDAPKPFGIPAPLFRLLGGRILAEMLLTDMIISNKKMIEQLGVTLKHSTYREGIRALVKKCRRNHS